MGLHPYLGSLPFVCAALGCTTSSEVGRFNGDGAADASPEAAEAGKIEIAPVQARIALGASTSCAIASSGEVLCWGDNYVGQLGIGSMTPEYSSTPLPVAELGSGARGLFGGAVAQCAVLHDGHSLCWGDSVFGEFQGRGAVHAISLTPFETPGLSSVASMAVGTYFHCALNTEGDVKCYGLNGAGQLGSGSLDDNFVPGGVIGLGPARNLAASQSGYFACAVTIAGAVYCWGDNSSGQLGNGTTEDALAPTPVSDLASGVARVTAGRDHACAIANETTYCWGDNSEGQLGTPGPDQTTPSPVSNVPPFVAIAAGATHTCGLTEGGAVHCWGGTTVDPGEVISSGIVEIAAGGGHACALSEQGVLTCWGRNESGQLGPFQAPGAPL